MVRKLRLRHINDFRKIADTDTPFLGKLIHDLQALLVGKCLKFGFIL